MNGLEIAAAAIPAACIGYGFLEAKLYRLRRYQVPALPAGAQPISILQVSDLHFRLEMKLLRGFLQSLHQESFDLVLATGDLLGHPSAVEDCLELLNGLTATMGRYFVLGASDYYAPQFRNYVDYFTGRRRIPTRANRTDDFRAGLKASGWTDLTNITLLRQLKGTPSQITGLDDPYLHRDDRSLLVRDPSASFAICVVHDPSPYHEAASAGFDLVTSGHTHGGQVRLPFVGALVTNSDIPRRYARGLNRIAGTWLFVNPGLGTSKYAPFRFLCRPEASVLNLTP